MVITPAQIVDAPLPRGLRYGLFTAAYGPRPLPPHGAGGGVTYRPESCGHAHYYDVDCHPTDEKVFDDSDAWVEGTPFTAYASVQCGAAGTTMAEVERLAQVRLQNGAQTIAEYGLAQSLAAGATPLASADVTLTGVVGSLEQWLHGVASADYGNQGYLHAPVRFASYAADENLIIHDGSLRRTPFGSIWIFGGGYPDDGMIYISGQVTVWQGDVTVVPAAQTMDRTLNQHKVIAEREYVVTYDCVAASAEYAWAPIS